MPDVVTGIAGGGLVLDYLSNDAASDAAGDASAAQLEAAKLGIEEQRRQFDAIQKVLAPYVGAGADAIGKMSDFSMDPEFIKSIEDNPMFQGIVKQGEDSLLQNASATGGVRGGNVQGALSQYRPQVMNQFINDEFARLSTVAGFGQASAAGQASAGMNTGSNISNLITQGGQAKAGGILAQGQADANKWDAVGKAFGIATGGTF